MLKKITPLILTYNEEPNIARVLDKLTWASQIVVIDSFSTDRTLEIIESYPSVKCFQHSFESFANQCNYGLSKITSEWVLSLDADYVLSDALIQEMQTLSTLTSVSAYAVELKYCVFSKPLKGTLLPPRKVLYRKENAVYRDDGHAHQVCIEGVVGKLNSCIYHDDRKSLSRWLWAQDKYMVQEAQKLVETPFSELSIGDKIRQKKAFAPLIIFVYCLVIKAGLLDGWRGWYYAFQRMFAETLLSIRLIEIELGKS